MRADPPVFALLHAAPAVVAILGDRDPFKVFGGGEVPQGTKLPYVAWALISGEPENYLADRPDMDAARVQIDCWAIDRTSAKALFAAVEEALELQAHEVSFNDDSQDEETRAWRRSSDFRFWVPRS